MEAKPAAKAPSGVQEILETLSGKKRPIVELVIQHYRRTGQPMKTSDLKEALKESHSSSSIHTHSNHLRIDGTLESAGHGKLKPGKALKIGDVKTRAPVKAWKANQGASIETR